jgi:hypothetical protein
MDENEPYSAYEAYAEQPLITDAVLAVAAFLTGGDPWDLLHIQVEDDNLEDGWFDFADEDHGEWLRDLYNAAAPYERLAFDMLKALTEQERVTAVRIQRGIIDREGNEIARQPFGMRQSPGGVWLP